MQLISQIMKAANLTTYICLSSQWFKYTQLTRNALLNLGDHSLEPPVRWKFLALQFKLLIFFDFLALTLDSDTWMMSMDWKNAVWIAIAICALQLLSFVHKGWFQYSGVAFCLPLEVSWQGRLFPYSHNWIFFLYAGLSSVSSCVEVLTLVNISVSLSLLLSPAKRKLA